MVYGDHSTLHNRVSVVASRTAVRTVQYVRPTLYGFRGLRVIIKRLGCSEKFSTVVRRVQYSFSHDI